MDRFLPCISHFELEADVQLAGVLFCLADVQVALEKVARQDLDWLVDVEDCLLPVRLFLVGRGGKGDFLLAVAEVAVEPSHKTMHNAIQLDV